MGRFRGCVVPFGEDRRVNGIVDMVAFGVRLGTGGAGDKDLGVVAGTGVLGGIGVFVGSAIAIWCLPVLLFRGRWYDASVRTVELGSGFCLFVPPSQWLSNTFTNSPAEGEWCVLLPFAAIPASTGKPGRVRMSAYSVP